MREYNNEPALEEVKLCLHELKEHPKVVAKLLTLIVIHEQKL